ncbi:hypothetical protein GGH99_003941, partial [Coemansia sp. RSA 1285]
ATESFFAPLDEVCSDSGADQQSFVGAQPGAASSAAPAGSQTSRQQQLQLQLHHSVALPPPPPPPMGSHFSPSMPSMGAGFHRPLQPHAQAAEWQGSAAPSYYARPQHTQQRHSQALGPHGARNAPDAIFAQMPSFAAPPQQQQQAMAADGLLASGMKRARIGRDNTRSFALDEENNNNNNNEDESDDYDSDDSGSESTRGDSVGSSSKRRRRRRHHGRDPAGSSSSLATPHKRDQERRFDCDVCSRSFARQYNLKTHRLTHFPEAQESRPFKCLHCIKAFTRKHDLRRHVGLHKRADKYNCPRCHRGFQRKDALKRHADSECSM